MFTRHATQLDYAMAAALLPLMLVTLIYLAIYFSFSSFAEFYAYVDAPPRAAAARRLRCAAHCLFMSCHLLAYDEKSRHYALLPIACCRLPSFSSSCRRAILSAAAMRHAYAMSVYLLR